MGTLQPHVPTQGPGGPSPHYPSWISPAWACSVLKVRRGGKGFRCSICFGLLCAISLFRLFLQTCPDSLSMTCVFSEVLLHPR